MSVDRHQITGSMGALIRSPRMSAGWWLLLIAVTSLTNVFDFVAAPKPGDAPSGLFAVAALLRVILIFWMSYALIRRLAEVPNPAAPKMAFGRYALFQLGMFALIAGATALATRLFGMSADGVGGGLLMFLVLVGVYLAVIRLLAWQAALAVGDRDLGPRGAWLGLADAKGALVTAYLPIALLAGVHAVLTRLALATDSIPALAGLALVDGIVSGVQLALICALSVAAWQLARARGGALRGGVAVA